MSRITACGARIKDTSRVKAPLPCCQQVRRTLTRTCCVRAPSQVRFPPQTLRRDHHPADGLFRRMVGRIQTRSVQEREQKGLFVL